MPSFETLPTSAEKPKTSQPEPDWKGTLIGKERIARRFAGDFEQPSHEFPYGRVKRPDGNVFHIVGRDVSVMDGVYPGGGEREMLYVEETEVGAHPDRPWEGNLLRAFSELQQRLELLKKKRWHKRHEKPAPQGSPRPDTRMAAQRQRTRQEIR